MTSYLGLFCLFNIFLFLSYFIIKSKTKPTSNIPNIYLTSMTSLCWYVYPDHSLVVLQYFISYVYYKEL